MSEASEIKVGSKAIFKVGHNVVTVEVLRPMGDGRAFWVKNIANGKEFIIPSARLNVQTVSIEPVAEPAPETPESVAAPVPEEPEETPAELETEAEDNTPNPAPESGKPTKNMTLMDAAVTALKETGKPMNTREMVKAAIEKGYWVPTDCKTPEQTLYGSIFREIKTKEQPRIVKSDVKGKFQIA